VWGTVLAIFVLATGVQGLQLVSGAQWVASLFHGVALIVAVGLAVNRRRRIARADDVEAQDPPPASPADVSPAKDRRPDGEVVVP
jgi:ribose transport system permease protein